MDISTLIEKRSAAAERVDEINETLATDGPSDELAAEAEALVSEVENLDERISTFVKSAESRAKFDGMVAGLTKTKKTEEIKSMEIRSIGEMFTDSQEVRAYSGHGTSAAIECELRAPLLSTDVNGKSFYAPSRVALAEPFHSTPLLNAFNRIQVSTGLVEWVKTPSAAPLAEVVAEGAQKPEATVTATVESIALQTIAHYVEASRQILEDAPALRDYINNLLVKGVYDKLEALVAGSLVAANSGIETVEGADLLKAIRKGIGSVQGNGYNPTTVALNPADWADLDGAVMGSTLNGPVVRQNFWGLDVVAAAAVPAGMAYVGDFRSGATVFERNNASVYITDSHAGNFTKNIFTILAETRAVAKITRPEAIVMVTAGTDAKASTK